MRIRRRSVIAGIVTAVGLLTGLGALWQSHVSARVERTTRIADGIQQAKAILAGPVVYVGEIKPSYERIASINAALERLDGVLRIDAEHDEALMLRGICYQALGDPENSLEAHSRALRIVRKQRGRPARHKEAVLLNNIGDLYLDLCRLEDAEIALREALALDASIEKKETRAFVRVNLADVLLRRQKPADALAYT